MAGEAGEEGGRKVREAEAERGIGRQVEEGRVAGGVQESAKD